MADTEGDNPSTAKTPAAIPFSGMPAGKKGLQATAPQITPPKPQVPKPPAGEIEWTIGTYEKPSPDAIDYPGEDGDMDLEAPPKNMTDLLDMIDRRCALATNEVELDEIWESVQLHLVNRFPPDIDAAEKILARHKKRLGIA